MRALYFFLTCLNLSVAWQMNTGVWQHTECWVCRGKAPTGPSFVETWSSSFLPLAFRACHEGCCFQSLERLFGNASALNVVLVLSKEEHALWGGFWYPIPWEWEIFLWEFPSRQPNSNPMRLAIFSVVLTFVSSNSPLSPLQVSLGPSQRKKRLLPLFPQS